MQDFTWSKQQTPVFDWFKHPIDYKRSLVLRARAGCAKTTTIIEGVRHAPEGARILFTAFNKRIADELQDKLNHPGATAMTMHSLGFRAVRRRWENVRVEGRRGERSTSLSIQAVGSEQEPDAMIRLVSKLHSKAREICPLATSPEDLRELAYDFDCVPDEEWGDDGWDLERVLSSAYKAMQLAAKRPTTGIDFSDMLYLPVKNGWLRPTYDMVVVDEAQDLGPCQIIMAQRVCKGRMCIVGDDRQAIYGFRGADSGVLDRIKGELDADELTLTTTYRCGKRIVEEAQSYVPDFTADPMNAAGSVSTILSASLTSSIIPGDVVLSRLNAPLISGCLSALRAGKAARVEGRDVAAGLRALIKRLATGPAKKSIPAFLKRLDTWESRETSRVRASRSKAIDVRVEAIEDKAECLRQIAEGATGIKALQGRVKDLFDAIGSGVCIVFSSVHRAKGLEWDRVYVLQETLKDGRGDIEEDNIAYVAITRARKELVFVSDREKIATS